MPNTQIISISLPSGLATKARQAARSNHMTQSELIRTSLREYLEARAAREAIIAYRGEKATGKLRKLGNLAELIV